MARTRLTSSELRMLALDHLIFDTHVRGAPRVSLDPLYLSPLLHDAAVCTAEAAVHFLGDVGARAHTDPEEAAHYGLGPATRRLIAASHEAGETAGLARVDLLLGEDGAWHVCEVNADCPGGHNEATALPLLARRRGAQRSQNPTRLLPELTEALALRAQGGAVGLVFATAYAEDLQVCAYLQRALKRRNVEAHLVSPDALRWDGQVLRAGGKPVQALYRFFPTEYFEDFGNVGDLEAALRAGKLRTLSSFSQMWLQSKMVMARAWALRPRLSPQAAAFVDGQLPWTQSLLSLSREQLVGTRVDWVVKAALGRVGDEVYVGSLTPQSDWAGRVDHARARALQGEAWIAQRFIPQARLPASAGEWAGQLVTLGAYVLDGRFVGYFARLTQESHVSHDALVAPVLIPSSVAPVEPVRELT